MKNISKILFIAALAIAAAACNREEDDIFDSSSAARINQAIVDCQKILTGAQNGWIMSYFPHDTQKYGGYSFILKFGTDGTVTAAGEVAGPGYTSTSLYQINQSAGVTLCFDTYNDILTSFADPTPVIYGDKGTGMGGDNDFLVISADENKVVLKGKKSGSYSTLVPMSSSDWDGYLSALAEAETEMKFSSYVLKKGDVTIPVKSTYRTFTFTCTDEEGSTFEKTMSYILTPTGYKMYEPVEVMGIEFDEFVYNSQTESFAASTDASAVLEGVVPPLGQALLDGDWTLTYANLGPWGKSQFDAVDQVLKSNENETLTYALLCHGNYLLSSYTSAWGFTFVSGGTYAGQVGITATPDGDNKVSMKASGSNQGNGDYYVKSDNFSGYVNVFGYSTARTFTITTDSKRSPSWLLLTEDGNPDNWFKLIPDFTTYK